MTQEEPGNLDDVAQARRAIVETHRRPAWLTPSTAALTGLATGLAVSGEPVEVGLAVVALVALIVLAFLDQRHRGPRLTDERAVLAGMGAYAVFYVPLAVAMMLRTQTWWVQVLLGVVVAAAAYGHLRFMERYHARRIADGDYGPYDL